MRSDRRFVHRIFPLELQNIPRRFTKLACTQTSARGMAKCTIAADPDISKEISGAPLPCRLSPADEI